MSLYLGYFVRGSFADGKQIILHKNPLSMSVCDRRGTDEGLLEKGMKICSKGHSNKVESVEKGLWKDGQWIEDLEITGGKDFLDWNSSLKSNVSSVLKCQESVYVSEGTYFGLINKSNRLHGRGVKI